MNLANWLARTASIAPKQPALFLGEDCVADYRAFWDDTCAIAGWLKAQGVRPNDRVAIFMKNAPEYLTVLYGIWAAGAVVVPINAKLHSREVEYILVNSGSVLAFVSVDVAEKIQSKGTVARLVSVPGESFDAIRLHEKVDDITPRKPDELAWLFYTSGTTGKPKGVMISHRMLMVMSLCYAEDVDTVSCSDTTIYAAPMSHGAGLYNIVHVRAGARHVCPASGGFEPLELFELAERFGNAHLFAAPTMVKRMTKAARGTGRTGEGLRTVVYAGGPMYNADIIDAVDHFGPVFIQIYGQGECPMGITALSRLDVADRTHSDWQARLQSVGRAQSAVEVAIGAADGTILPPGQQGEILVRGDTVMPGYWRNHTATEDAFANGWLRTGDLGVLNVEGYLTLKDRSKDVIITGGSNVYPREVEEVLMMDPQVEEACVVGRAHLEWGEEVVAFYVGKAEPAQLDRLCLEHIARFKRPKTYIAIDELPKNNYGKVLKTELRARLRFKPT